jgi:hypothetical protein
MLELNCENLNAIDKINQVFSHIKNVQRNCYKLGIRLINRGEVELGRNLISNGQIHDNSKFKGIEFSHLFHGDPMLPEVVKHHQSINPHHPEHWGSIHSMPRVYVAEMVCDWYARSSEFGTGLKEWVNNHAMEKFGFTKDSPVYAEIFEFMNLLLSPSFTPEIDTKQGASDAEIPN